MTDNIFARQNVSLECQAAIMLSRYAEAKTSISKGLELAKRAVKGGDAVTFLSENTFAVQGSKERYTVTPGACTCPARVRCYHRWAVSLLSLCNLLPTAPVSAAVASPVAGEEMSDLWLSFAERGL